MSLIGLMMVAEIAAAQPIGPPVPGNDFDLDGAITQLVSADDGNDGWSIPDFDDDDDGPEGAQLRLRLLKLKLKVPI